MALHSYYVPDGWLCHRCEYIALIKETETTGRFECTRGITTCNGIWCNECAEFKDRFEGILPPLKSIEQVECEWKNMFFILIADAKEPEN